MSPNGVRSGVIKETNDHDASFCISHLNNIPNEQFYNAIQHDFF